MPEQQSVPVPFSLPTMDPLNLVMQLFQNVRDQILLLLKLLKMELQKLITVLFQIVSHKTQIMFYIQKAVTVKF